jgi:hypothetical protein
MTASNLYSTLAQDGAEAGERNDCGVKALAAACGATYAEARTALFGYGRRRGQSTEWHALWMAVHDFEFTAFNITRTRVQWGSVKTVASKLRPNRTYLVHTSRHILCVKGGEVHDWTDGRCHRIQRVWQILAK